MKTTQYKGHLIHYNDSTKTGFVSFNLGRGFILEKIESRKQGREKIDCFITNHSQKEAA
jgi:hypothetical protein